MVYCRVIPTRFLICQVISDIKCLANMKKKNTTHLFILLRMVNKMINELQSKLFGLKQD